MVRICVAMKDGTVLYLHKDAIGGIHNLRDSYGKIFAFMKTTKRKRDAWQGPAAIKEEVISDLHLLMELGFCQKVSYLY